MGSILEIPKSTKKYIKNYEKIKYSRFPHNRNVSCGFVAGSLMLYYWYALSYKKLIPESTLTQKMIC